jgi:hypothetical protein
VLLWQVQLEVKLRVDVKDFIEINNKAELSIYTQDTSLFFTLSIPMCVVFLENKVTKYKERCVKTDLYFI